MRLRQEFLDALKECGATAAQEFSLFEGDTSAAKVRHPGFDFKTASSKNLGCDPCTKIGVLFFSSYTSDCVLILQSLFL